jgi:hypothetical protein
LGGLLPHSRHSDTDEQNHWVAAIMICHTFRHSGSHDLSAPVAKAISPANAAGSKNGCLMRQAAV